MKAVRVHGFGGPEVMHLEEVAAATPGPDQVVVSIRAAGVNPVDTYIRAGTYARKPALPYTPGTDGAGQVKAVGAEVSRLAAGDRVYITGTLGGSYAEECLCEESTVFPLPARVSFAQGAAMGVPYGTAHRALFHRAQARPGESLLVHGASGGVGLAAVQLAAAFGMYIVGTAGSPNGLKLVRAEGAHNVLDHHEPGYLDRALALTDGRGFDVILEMLANVNLGKVLPILALNGRVVVIGSRGTVEINPRDTMTRDASILGMSLWNVSQPDLLSIHSALAAGLMNSTLRPVIAQEIPLAEAERAHRAVMESSTHGKIVLIP
jgi:NADPH:quinone reductase